MKKGTIVLLAALVLFSGLFSSCETQSKQSSTSWNNIWITVLNDPYEGYNENMELVKNYSPFVIKSCYTNKKKKEITFTKNELDGYIAYLKKCGMTFTDGNECFYADRDCTIQLTPETKVPREEFSGEQNGPTSYFAIYTKVEDSITDMSTNQFGGLFTEYFIFDAERNRYIVNGNADGDGRTLLPPQTQDEDIREYIFKNHEKNGSNQKFLDNAEYSSIKYVNYHAKELTSVLQIVSNDPNFSTMYNITLPTDYDEHTFSPGDNMQGKTMIITLKKTFKQLGIDNYKHPVSTIMFKDANNQTLTLKDQKIPYNTTKQSLLDLLNAFLKNKDKEIAAAKKVENIVSVSRSDGTAWTEGSNDTLKGENITVKLKEVIFDSEVLQ